MDSLEAGIPIKKRKIAFLVSDIEIEGAVNRVLMELVTDLRGTMEIVILATEGNKQLSGFPEDVKIMQLGKVPYQNSNRSWRALNTFFSIPKIIRNLELEKPEVVVSITARPNLANVLAKKISRGSYQALICEQNFNSLQYSHNFIEIVFRALMKLLYPGADAVVAVSNDLTRDLIESFGVSKQKSFTIYNPFDLQTICTLAEKSLDFPWGQQDRPYLVNAGRLTKQKNHALLLRAFKLLHDEYDCRLLILGEGPLRRELEEQASELGLTGEVFFPGRVSNPYFYFRNAHAFVLSSDHEGLPSVLIEALACGCPVISTDCPTGPREILEDGKCGVLVPVNDAHALADSMLALLKNPLQRKQLAGLGRERAKSFDREIILGQYKALLSQLIEP